VAILFGLSGLGLNYFKAEVFRYNSAKSNPINSLMSTDKGIEELRVSGIEELKDKLMN
jgi:hypothetical protein